MLKPGPSAAPRRRAKFIVLPAVALLLGYLASPYYSLWRFGETLRANDMNALAARVDFPEVRDSLKKQVRDHFFGVLDQKKNDPIAQLFTSAQPSVLDRLIDAYITPDGLAMIISNPAPIKNASSFASLAASPGERKEIEWSKAQRAFFTSPRDFAADHEGITLRFRFNGFGWKLREIDLNLRGGGRTSAVLPRAVGPGHCYRLGWVAEVGGHAHLKNNAWQRGRDDVDTKFA